MSILRCFLFIRKLEIGFANFCEMDAEINGVNNALYDCD